MQWKITVNDIFTLKRDIKNELEDSFVFLQMPILYKMDDNSGRDSRKTEVSIQR